MSALLFTLRDTPAQRLDLAPLTPERLAGMSERDIGKIELQTTRVRVCVGDVFALRMGDTEQVQFDGGSERFDRVGHGMSHGTLHVDGDVGIEAGRTMRGGKLTIGGNAGPFAGSGMKGGTLEIAGNAGEQLGGPRAGEMAGMRGGVIVVRGNVGARVGDRMRRGAIIVEGEAGAYAGSRMIAGSLIVGGRAGALPGYLMARGTLVLVDGCAGLSPTFADCGVHDLVANTLMASFIQPHSTELAARMRQPWQRLTGDLAALGKGEIFYPPALNQPCQTGVVGCESAPSPTELDRHGLHRIGVYRLRACQSRALRGPAPELRVRSIDMAMRNGRAALYRAMDRRAPEMDRRALALRISRAAEIGVIAYLPQSVSCFSSMVKMPPSLISTLRTTQTRPVLSASFAS